MQTAALLLALFAVCNASWSPLRVGSWNTMLQPWFLWADDVYENIPRNLDVLALQEVWTTEARDAILQSVGNTYGYHYWPQERNEQVGCDFTDQNIQGLSYLYVSCLVQNGVDTQTLQQPLTPTPMECLQWAIVLGTWNNNPNNQLCLACLINGLEILPHDQAFGVLNMCAVGAGPKYGHNGANGQLILSRFPIQDVSEHTFDAFVANRVNIHATIDGVRFGFGHFAFNLLEDAYPPAAPLMYGDLQPDQVKDFTDAGVDVIVGDLNSGPNYQPTGYNQLFDAGYHLVSPNVPTWCDAAHADFLPCINALAIPSPIDHIFVRNSSKIVSFGANTFNEKPIMSDHIGVKVQIYNCWWCFFW